MGLSTAIAGGIIMIALVYVFLVLPVVFDKTITVSDAKSVSSDVENTIGKTNIKISNLNTTSHSQLIRFDLTNENNEKLWDYEKFDVFITYDASIALAKVKSTEKLSYVAPIGGIQEPIDVDSVTTSIDNCDPCTFSHKVTPVGDNKLLVVAVSAADSVDSVTYNGQSLTQIQDENRGGFHAELWYLVNPPAGSNTVNVDMTGTARVVLSAISFTGVHQTSPIDANAGDTGGTSTPSVNISTNFDNSMIVDVVTARDGPMVADAGQIERWDDLSNNHAGAGSTKDTVSSGSYTMGWTNSDGNSDWAIVAAALRPANDPVLYSLQWMITDINPDIQDPDIINLNEIGGVIGKLSYPIFPGGDVILSTSTDLGATTTSSLNAP